MNEQDDPTGYKYVPADKKIICSDMEKPEKATLLHNGKELQFDYKDKTLTIVIPAEMTTKLLDVVKVEM